MEFRKDEKERVLDRICRLQDSLLPHLDLQFDEKKRRTPKRSVQFSGGGGGSPLGLDYFTKLHSSREFRSSDCLQKLSRGSGLRQELEGFSGTLLTSLKTDRKKLDTLWSKIHTQLDTEWSKVALEDGVKQARAGKYDEAIESYKQSIKLDPTNADSYVARGAALANKGQYREAIEDFNKALEIEPMDRNALEYKDRIEKRLMEREMKNKKEDFTPKLQYREDLFGRVEQKQIVDTRPASNDVEHALSVLKRSHQRKHNNKSKKPKIPRRK